MNGPSVELFYLVQNPPSERRVEVFQEVDPIDLWFLFPEEIVILESANACKFQESRPKNVNSFALT